MARRYPRGRKNHLLSTKDPLLALIVEKDVTEVPLKARDYVALRRLAYLAWRHWRAKTRKKKAESQEAALKKKILAVDRPIGVLGLVSWRGRGGSRLLISDISGVKVLKPTEFLDYLGEYVSEVVTGVDISLQIAVDPKRYAELLTLVAEHFGKEAAEQMSVTFDKGKLDKLIERGDLEEPTSDVVALKDESYQINSDPAETKRTRKAKAA